MLKKDVDHFRRNLKLDNHLLTIHELLNVYVVKESTDIYFKQRISFALLSRDEQELFIQNFRKTLMGQIDQKLFPLRFKDTEDLTSQSMLYKSLTAESDKWEEKMISFVKKLIEGQPYEADTVFTFIRGEFISSPPSSAATIEEEQSDAFVNPFVLCTINETKRSDNELLFDYVEKEFTYHVEVNPVIDLQAPINGFLFPTFTEGVANVNELLYTTRKAYVLEHFLLDEVLQVEEKATAEDEQAIFSEVIKRVAGEQLDTRKLSSMYEEVHERILQHEELEEEDEPIIDYRDVDELLVQSGVKGVETEDVKEAFQSIVENPVYEIKAMNAVPKFTTKSVKVKTKVANFSLRPKDLPYVRKVNIDGKLCLVIEIDEESEIDGYSLIPEASFTEIKPEES